MFKFFSAIFSACLFFLILALIVVTLSMVKNDPPHIWVPSVVFTPILLVHVLFLFFFRKMRIETFKEGITIYLRKFNDQSFRSSYKYGYTIRYLDIDSIDLMPIKTFGFNLSHQINIKLKNNEMVYINQFSNLDVLCGEMRQLLLYSRKHPSEFIIKENTTNESVSNTEKK